MAQLSDNIEQFIKELMCEDTRVELKRNELAQHFGCAPSQINYVLATRFSVDHGYIIESRRGGGGYVRIVRMQPRGDGNLLDALLTRVGNSVDEETANAIIAHLADIKLITSNEAALMRAAGVMLYPQSFQRLIIGRESHISLTRGGFAQCVGASDQRKGCAACGSDEKYADSGVSKRRRRE